MSQPRPTYALPNLPPTSSSSSTPDWTRDHAASSSSSSSTSGLHHQAPASAHPYAAVASTSYHSNGASYDAAPVRQRGESSPVQSRHRPLDAATTSTDSTTTTHDGAGRMMRRQSSGTTTPRRIVDGREETREERRARKDRERAARGDELEHGTGEGSPTGTLHHRTRSRPSRPNGLPSSPPADELSPLSLGAPPLASAAAAARAAPPSTTSSKSVLTIALQRAQSAVLLDSANNVPAAISAYTQSVRLLKEVMARVEEGSRRERERDRERGLDRAGPRPGETEEDVAKRVAKMERKERAKVDEARRLRVIHDTYEERIRMLLSMGTNPSDPIGPGSTPSTPSTLHSDSPTASPPPPLGHRHRSSRSISSLSTVSTPPASFAPALNGTAPPTVVVQSSTPHQDPSRTTNSSLSLSEDEWTPAAEGIGSAMLLSSPPASPMDPMMPSSRPTPTLSSLRIVEESGPSQLQQRLLPHMARGRSGDTINEGDAESDNDLPPRSRSSISSDGTATDMSRTLTVAAPSDPSTHYANSSFRPSPPREPSPPPHIDIKPSSPLDAALRDLVISVPSPTDSTSPMGPTDSHQRTHSMGSSESDDVVPVTALDYGVGWPRDHSSGVVPANGVPTSDSTVTADSFRPTSVGSSDTMHRTHSAQTSATSEGMRATRSGDSMQRTASGESVSGVSTRGSSLFGPGGFARMTTLGPNSSPEDPSRQSASPFGLGPPPSASANAASRPRPSRSASLATPPTFSHAPPVPSKKDRLPLVSSSTALGTISQRRQRSPHPSLSGIPTSHYTDVQDDKEEREHVVQHDGYDLPARPGRLASAARPVSAERTVASEFGLQPHTTGPSGSYVSASLPTRLRTLSQPGKRPQLQSFQSEQPPLPPLLVAGNRSFSGSGAPSYGRKASIPTPTSLNAPTFPPLGRSNSSSSSHGSHHSDRNPGHFTSQSQADTPTSSNFSRPSGGVSNTTVSTLSNPPPPSSEVTSLGLPAIRRPFFLMRQLLSTIESPGAYLTARLYVPPQVWTQGGVKLVALETKVRMLDLLLTGLDGVDKAGSAFLNAGEGQGRWAAAEFVKELDAFEGLTDGIQSTLSKKLGYGTSGKKMGATSFSAWSSKLSRSLDRVTNGRNLDHPATYVEALARVFRLAGPIDSHLILMSDARSAYASLRPDERQRIEQRLRRLSEFFGQVICRFVMRDVGMLVDKYVKRSGTWFSE